MRAHVYFSVLGLSAGLHLRMLPRSYAHLSCCWETLFPWCPPAPLALTLPPLPPSSRSLRGRGLMETGPSILTAQLCFCGHCGRKLLWCPLIQTLSPGPLWPLGVLGRKWFWVSRLKERSGKERKEGRREFTGMRKAGARKGSRGSAESPGNGNRAGSAILDRL